MHGLGPQNLPASGAKARVAMWLITGLRARGYRSRITHGVSQTDQTHTHTHSKQSVQLHTKSDQEPSRELVGLW